jgi:hypothetical protein
MASSVSLIILIINTPILQRNQGDLNQSHSGENSFRGNLSRSSKRFLLVAEVWGKYD